MSEGTDVFAATISRFSGFAHEYDTYRAQPPEGLALLLAQYTHTRQPKLVVDLGSGTGLSSRYWADRALRVIGIEPSGAPMTPSWRADQVWAGCNERAMRMETKLPGQRPPRWEKGSHAERMQESGCFEFARSELGSEPATWHWSARVRVGVVGARSGATDPPFAT